MSEPQITPESVTAGVKLAMAVGDAIRDLGEVPAGHLYARVMGYMSLRSFDALIDILVKAGLVRRSSHLLIWVGPK